MGQQISSGRLSTLFSWPSPESDGSEPFIIPCRCKDEEEEAVHRVHHQRKPVRRRLSLIDADSLPKKQRRNFDTLSCFKNIERHALETYERCRHGSLIRTRSRSKRKNLRRSKSQERETTFTMSSSICNCDDDRKKAECCSMTCLRNESDSGLSNACASTSSSNRIDDDIQNGNDIEVCNLENGFDSRNGCTKSSSIDRYMSALTDRIDRTHINECRCDEGTSKCGSLKSRTPKTGRCKLSNSKSCSKQLDMSGTQECFGCTKDSKEKHDKVGPKKKRWVSKFGSKLSKNGKISVNGTNRSTDSGLDIAGSSNDSKCVCTGYRKVDEPCRFSQNSDTNHLTLGFARDRANFVRAPNTSNSPTVSFHRQNELSCEGSHCHAHNPDTDGNNLQQQAFNIANLPFNITVTRVELARGNAADGPNNSNRVYHTIRGNGVYSDLNGVYETFQNSNGSSIQLVAEDAGSGARQNSGGEGNVILLSVGSLLDTPVIDIRWTAEQDCEERARIRRAWEIFEGVEPPPGYRPHIQVIQSPGDLRTLLYQQQKLAVQQTKLPPRIHTQVDFIHCLVPDLQAINNCSFYWGKMDRYEAERLLEGKPEGTFLLRDSAQEEYLFSVSFRKYGRSLHARIEQFNHKFSFDSHDPGVYAANTVTGLIEHYKDPACVMFFEPMLTAPLSRTHAFPLQHLCRAVIASSTTYDGINELRLPQSMKAYLKEYHYRQRVRIKRFEGPPAGLRWEPEGLAGGLVADSDERH